jgi:hypothetical protein
MGPGMLDDEWWTADPATLMRRYRLPDPAGVIDRMVDLARAPRPRLHPVAGARLLVHGLRSLAGAARPPSLQAQGQRLLATFTEQLATARRTHIEDASDAVTADTVAADTVAADTVAADTVAADTVAADTVARSAQRLLAVPG